jgi:hypothetical protein
MRWYFWLIVVGLVLVEFEVCHFGFPATYGQSGPATSLPFRMGLQGFTNESSSPSGFPKLVLRQGETGILKINFTPEETNDTVSLRLWFYGKAPNFDAWENTWDVQNMSLPEGVTSSIDHSTIQLSNNTTRSADLVIVASPNARVGDFKVIFDVWFSPSYNGNVTTGTSKPFTLEISQGLPTTGGLVMNIALITVVIVVLLSALAGLAIVLKHRSSSKTTS